MQALLEHRRERLLVGQLATHRVTVAQNDDAQLARRLVRRHLRSDHAAAVRAQYAVVLTRLEAHARVGTHGVTGGRVQHVQALLSLQQGARSEALQADQIRCAQLGDPQPDLGHEGHKQHGDRHQHQQRRPRKHSSPGESARLSRTYGRKRHGGPDRISRAHRLKRFDL